MIFMGLFLIVWSLLVLKPTMPNQEILIIPPISESLVESNKFGPEKSISQSLYSQWPTVDSKIGIISFPSLETSWPIFEGTDDAQLDRGVGHYSGSVLPGMQDNSILSGHRDTVFRRIGELEIDDLINVKTSAGIFTYQVTGFQVVPRTDKTIIMPTPKAVLTLTTCFPFNRIGKTTDAFIVTSELVSSHLN